LFLPSPGTGPVGTCVLAAIEFQETPELVDDLLRPSIQGRILLQG
jgi:hypothetical protein